ncbi:putative entry exclusion protein TrbK-alt [Tardiphaga robiniae]|uniref:putative entry exclusion protein TrbK-alt n=1 Tax=Tardiphaga robiniae TaxID=943830 RepID=UPI0009D6C69F|nr:putative entry exclusion protein TrbK-alt [Tardiphaga robiniae]
MSAFSMFSRVAVVIAAGVTMLVAACAIQLRGDNDETASNPAAPQSTGTLEPSLTRCRTVRPEQTASYDYCRRIWAENRRRFFGQKGGAMAPAGSDALSSQPSELPPKDQSRMPQG